MKEKIDWYQEVLELEPGSKVFFPLARLLSESGQIEKATQTLRQGLDRHPEFIEARLYLIDLLFRNGQTELCEQQINLLAPLFTRYTGFWQAWGDRLSATGKDGDAGLALAFLAASFQAGPLTLSDVLEKGLQSTLETRAPQERTGGTLETKPVETPEEIIPSVEPELTVESKLVSMTPHKESPAAPILEDDAEEGEERFSLRTRSMAEVLAEQGDYAGALEIYQELSTVASSTEEAADLQQRIATLTAHLGTAQEPAPAAPVEEAFSGKQRVLSVLEALAERLEARVHG